MINLGKEKKIEWNGNYSNFFHESIENVLLQTKQVYLTLKVL